jgi:four helix bundle protein
MALRIYSVSIELVRQLRSVVERVRAKDVNLADQLQRALTSVPLNLHEGAYSQGRNVRARFHNALGSAAEVRACLEVAEALGYVEVVDDAVLDTLDRVIATLYRLARK